MALLLLPEGLVMKAATPSSSLGSPLFNFGPGPQGPKPDGPDRVHDIRAFGPN